MNRISYSVIVTILYEVKALEWLTWLKNDHINDVLEGGATSATIIKRDPENETSSGVTYEVRYEFDNRDIFKSYLEIYAPRLRQEGLERFPSEDGFQYRRIIGEILE